MLLLKAKAGQRIFIGNDVTIIVTKHNKGGATIAFDAPDHVKILRDRAIRKVAKEKR